MSRVYLGIGSNVDAERNIAAGIAALERDFGAVRLSPVYRTRAVGFSGSDFHNLAAAIETTLQPLQLKVYLNELEARHGRMRDVPRFSDRTLDIDLLLYDDLWLRVPGLTLPRPEILHFAHVLRPLADLAPEVLHPVAGKTLRILWRDFVGDRGGFRDEAGAA